MRFRQLGMSGLQVSEFCLGTMNFGQQQYGVGEADSIRVIRAFLEAGGNFLDSADAYNAGISEQILAKALAGRRDSVIIATKAFFPCVMNFGDPPPHPNALGTSRRHLTHALNDSLARLNTDYIDLYQVHCWDHRTPIEETLATLNDFVRSGKVRYVGLSNFAAWQIAESRQLCRQFGWEPFVTAQMQYSLICRTIEDDVIPVCRRYGIGILPWSPLGGRSRAKRLGQIDGLATLAWEKDVSPQRLVIAWLMARSPCILPIPGSSRRANAEDLLAAVDVTLSREEVQRIDNAVSG